MPPLNVFHQPLTPVQLAAMIALLAIAIGTVVYWLVVLGHVIATSRLPTARDGLKLDVVKNDQGELPRVCVVIPAHNEREVIAGLARSLLAQDYPRLSCVFSLDRCTDDTESILRQALAGDPRMTIHLVTQCPADWAGKVHAIHAAVKESAPAAQADLLLFIDADTLLDPGCVRACVALLQARKLDMLSLLSTLTSDRWFERAVQPAAGMELIRQYPPRRVGKGRESRPFANGQFMLFRREAYLAVGGHEAAKDQLLEDIDLARKIAWSDQTHGGVGVYMAAGMLHCRMYPDWQAFRRGWKRIYIEAANCKVSRLRQSALRVGLCGLAMPLGSAVAIVAGLLVGRATGDPLAWWCFRLGCAGIVTFFAALISAFRLGGTPIGTVIWYPFGAAATMGILSEAADELAQGVPVRWAGREYIRKAR